MQYAEVLPVTTEILSELKKRFQDLDATGEGQLTQDQYMSIPLWFELEESSRLSSARDHTIEVQMDIQGIAKYNRTQKLKQALFYIFGKVSRSTENESWNIRWLKDHDPLPSEPRMFDYHRFLRALCSDKDALQGLEKAFMAFSSNKDGSVTKDELLQVSPSTSTRALTALGLPFE